MTTGAKGPGLPAWLCGVAGAEEAPSMFGDGPALWANGKEICHQDANGRYDVRLTGGVIKKMRPQLVTDDRVVLRPSSSSDWLEVEVRGKEDEAFLLGLVTLAAQAHQPPPGTSPAPPPGAAALSKRCRFH